MFIVVSKENALAVSPTKIDFPMEVDIHSQSIYFIQLSVRTSKQTMFLQFQIIGKFYLKTKQTTL